MLIYQHQLKPVWLHRFAPLRGPPKVSDMVVGGISSVLTSDRCGYQCWDVHTIENRTALSMFNINIYIYIYNFVLFIYFLNIVLSVSHVVAHVLFKNIWRAEHAIYAQTLRGRLVCVFKNWKLQFKNIYGNTCEWKSVLKCVKCCLKTENDCLKIQTKHPLGFFFFFFFFFDEDS